MPTVNGTILHATGAVSVGTSVVFETISAPVVSGSAVASAARFTVATDDSGDFSLDLVGGDYTVTWLNQDGSMVPSSVIITVPASGGPYRFESLITSDVTFTYSYEPEYALKEPEIGTYRIKADGTLQFWNPTTSKWHTPWITGAENALRWAFGPGET